MTVSDQTQQLPNALLPAGYTNLRELAPGRSLANLFAVVSSFKPITKSQGTDLVCSLCLVDPTVANGLRVMLFKRKRENLPELDSPGVVIRLTNMKIQMFGESLQGISSKGTSFTTFHFQGLSLPVTVRVPPMENAYFQRQAVTKVTEEDRRTAKDLYEWWLTNFGPAHAGPANGVSMVVTAPTLKAPRPVLSTRQLKPNVFLDYACEILHIYPPSGLPSLQIAVMDYTENDNLEPSKSQSPQNSIHCPTPISGRRVIHCTLWDEHAEIGGRILKSGQIVLLKNVRCKWSSESFLELNMHGEQDGKSKKNRIVILGPGDKEHEQIRTQREEYIRLFEPQNEPLEPQDDEEFLVASISESIRPNEPMTVSARKSSRLQRDPVVSIKHVDAPIRTISEIFSQARIAKYRVRARVVGIIPNRLEECTRQYCRQCDKSFPPGPDVRPQCPHCAEPLNEESYVFMFSLLLEDSKAEGRKIWRAGKNETNSSLQAIVFGQDGEDFLPGIRPSNLYRNRKGLQVLKERLSKLLPTEDDDESNQPAPKRFCGTEFFDEAGTVGMGVRGSRDENDLPSFDFCVLSYYVEAGEDGERAGSPNSTTRDGEERRSVTVDGITSKNWRRRFRLFNSVLA